MESSLSETLTTLKTRRSCRSYLDRAVPEDILAKIIEAGTYAATGMGKQSPIILAVTNRKVRDRLSELNAAVLGTSGDPFYGAPAVLVVLANKAVPTFVYDGSLVMGNMMNAAAELGVSSCWIHRAKEVFETEEGKAILREAGVEGEYQGIGNLILGYDDHGTRSAAPRKENYVYWVK